MWRRRRADPVRGVAALAVIALVAAACGGDNRPGVSMAKVTTDVAFGAKADPDLAAPANFNPAPVTPEQAGTDLELPDQFFEPVTSLTLPRPALRSIREDSCPPAALDEFPDETAPLNVPMDPFRIPREGAYRWQKAGTLKSDETAGRKTEVSGFERRVIRNVEVLSETKDSNSGERTGATFTYETVQPDVGGSDIVVTIYQVKTDGRSSRAASENAAPVGEADESTYSAGDPERGLVIKRIEVLSREGETQSVFEPPIGLLLLPLRVAPGERFRSAATDPRSRQQMDVDGKVIKRDRVDACGDIIDGWRVRTKVSSNGPDGRFVRDYSYIVAPQYGAVLLYETISQAGAAAGDLELEYTVGQQDPDPLPPDSERRQ